MGVDPKARRAQAAKRYRQAVTRADKARREFARAPESLWLKITLERADTEVENARKALTERPLP